MRNSRFIIAMLAVIGLAFFAGCGGGGQGLRLPSNPLVISSSSLPTTLSGEYVDFDIPLGGGCDGTYVVEIIAGQLPQGVGTEQGSVAKLIGYVLEDGIFNFTVKVTDTSCTPFATVTQDYSWDIQQGPLAIVGATPAIVPQAQYDDPQKYTDIDALETVVFSTFVSYELIVAGGQGPYIVTVVDDPNDPDDGGLPLGVSMAPNSTSLVGSPVQVLSGGVPFRLTFRATDSVGQTVDRKLQWKISTPPILVATSSLVDGKAGTSYSDSLTLIDGVPPFAFELCDNAPGDDGDPDTGDNVNDDITYPPGLTPVINSWVNPALPFQLTNLGPAADNARLDKNTGRVGYPAETDDGPNYGPFPSEGLYFRETGPGNGSFFGTPRRRGQFTLFVHVYSTLVPNELGQHAFKQLTMSIDPSEPPVGTNPAFDMNPNMVTEGAFNPASPFGTMPEAEFSVLYNPDVTTDPTNGLKLSGFGGVPQDGKTDAPHESDVLLDLGEIEGEYTWMYDPITPLPGMSMFAPARFGTETTADANALQRSGKRPVQFTIVDEQLPLSVRAADTTITRDFEISVGPDVSIITYSTTSTTESDFWWNASDRFGLNDKTLTIQRVELLSSGTTNRNGLDATDMALTHSVPSDAFSSTPANPLGALLSAATGGDSSLDLLRPVVNATGWWDDMMQMNPKAARHGAHTDLNRTDNYYGAFGRSYSDQGNYQPSASSVDLPNVDGLTHDPANGIYADGGQMYFFESNNRFGVFIVRPDSKIYVPFAYQKSFGLQGFGDGMLFSTSYAADSVLRTCQLTVSPDGRVAAMKLKTDADYLYEHANSTPILLFSLTGEKIFGGNTYRIVNTNAASSTSWGGTLVLQAGSLALTNDRLYFAYLTQCPAGVTTSTSYLYRQSWQGMFFMRCGITSGSPELIPSTDGSWSQGPGSRMQGVTHHHGPNSTTSYTGGLIYTYTYYGLWPYDRYWHEDGMNLHEGNVAPSPFRVSADGSAVAFFAGTDTTNTYATNVYSSWVWVDYAGSGAKRISTTPRHHLVSGGRSHMTYEGPYEYANWGTLQGPTPGLEISDDGLAVAATFNTATTSISASSTYSSSTKEWPEFREDVIVCRSTSGTWGSVAESEVTKLTFGGAHDWRFGGLCFTAAGDGLVFWGGSSMYDSTDPSSSYRKSYHYMGAYYIYALGATNTVTSMMPTAAGGSPDGSGKVYTNTAPFNPAATSGLNNRFGVIHPFGGFLSKNRDFLYVSTVGPLSSSDGTTFRLVGMNVSTTGAGTINGKTNGRGFNLTGWVARYGFLPGYYYYPYYGTRYIQEYGYLPTGCQGQGLQVMAKDSGWVFFGAGKQAYGTITASTSYSSYGIWPYPAYYHYGYGYGGFKVFGFDADVGGPIADLSDGGWGSTGTSTSPRNLFDHMEVAKDGKSLSIVWISDYYTHYHNRERVGFVKNIDFNETTGLLDASWTRTDDAGDWEGSNGRAGESMSIAGRDFYYAYKSSSGNENDKHFTRQRLLDDGTWQKTQVTNSAGTGRINVLWTGR